MSERALHKAVADLLRVTLTDDVAWTTFPAGGGGKIRGALLKASGLQSGWPDVQLVYRGKYYGLELKTPRGSLSTNQRICHRQIQHAGGEVATCKSLNEVSRQLEAWGIPTRKHQIQLEDRVRAARSVA